MGEATWGFLGVLLGSLISIGAEFLRLHAAEKLSDKNFQREAITLENNFHRENLLKLQEAFATWIRSEGAIMAFDHITFKKFGAITQLPEELSNNHFSAARKFKLLVNRITNDHLRESLLKLFHESHEIGMRTLSNHKQLSVDSFYSNETEFAKLAEFAEDLIGVELRKYLSDFQNVGKS